MYISIESMLRIFNDHTSLNVKLRRRQIAGNFIFTIRAGSSENYKILVSKAIFRSSSDEALMEVENFLRALRGYIIALFGTEERYFGRETINHLILEVRRSHVHKEKLVA